MINIFIGKFDIKKILQKTQTFKNRKGEFVNAFIFNDSEKKIKNTQSNKIIKFISPKKKLDKNIISPVKVYIQQKTEPKIKKYNKLINIEDSENESKLLFEKKLNIKKSLVDKNKLGYLTLNNHYPLNKRNKYYLNQSTYYIKKPKTRNSYLTRTIEINKSNNLPRVYSIFNKSRNLKSSKNSSQKSLYFLSKNDLYY